MSITWGDIGICLVIWIVGSFVAGAIATWWEQRKWHKEQQRKWDKKNKG